MSYLVCTAWIKDEAPYLSEWIEFHLLQGFERFYIYDNGSTDNLLDVLDPYIKADIVELRRYPPEVTTRKNFWVMKTTIDEFKGHHKWLFHHSIDEYMFCPTSGKTVAEFLKDYEDYSGLAVPWKFYGANGHQTKTDGLVIDRFTEFVYDSSNHIKTIIKVDAAIDSIGNPHVYTYNTGHAVYSNKLQHVTSTPHGGATENPHYDLDSILINHYVTMSKEEYEAKMNKGLLDHSQETRRAENDGMWDYVNVTAEKFQNYDILKYSDQVKENMKNRYK